MGNMLHASAYCREQEGLRVVDLHSHGSSVPCHGFNHHLRVLSLHTYPDELESCRRWLLPSPEQYHRIQLRTLCSLNLLRLVLRSDVSMSQQLRKVWKLIVVCSSPIPLLWNIQMDLRVKCSIIALLGVGIFASTAAIVRLTVTVNLSATTGFLYSAMPVAAWAQAELGLGVIVANLSALRPLLEKIINLRSTIRSGGKRDYTDPKSGENYLELEEGAPKRTTMGPETRIYGGDLDDSNSSLGDDRSTKNIVEQETDSTGIRVDREIRVSHQNKKGDSAYLSTVQHS